MGTTYSYNGGELTTTPPLEPHQARRVQEWLKAQYELPYDSNIGRCHLEIEGGEIRLQEEYGWGDDEAWVRKLIAEVIEPFGLKLNGELTWSSSDCDCTGGTIYVKDNQVEEVCDVTYNPGPTWDRKPAPTT